jgi:hypothetical protein
MFFLTTDIAMELGITDERKPNKLFSIGDVVDKKITDKL